MTYVFENKIRNCQRDVWVILLVPQYYVLFSHKWNILAMMCLKTHKRISLAEQVWNRNPKYLILERLNTHEQFDFDCIDHLTYSYLLFCR